MKLYEVTQIVKYLEKFKKISSIFRVEENILKLVFDLKHELFFDLNREGCSIYKAKNFIISKDYKSPFDIFLKKYINNSSINSVEVIDDDKIIRFNLTNIGAYKKNQYILQFELINKKSNLIVANREKNILGALKYVTDITSRQVTINSSLTPVDKGNYSEDSNEIQIDDIEEYLNNVHKKKVQKELDNLKKIRIKSIDKKYEKFMQIYKSIKSSKEYYNEANENEHIASIILSNLNNIKNYQKEITLTDFNGKEISIELHKPRPYLDAEFYFNKAKKAKAKAKNSHIEIENINDKISYLKGLKQLIINSTTVQEINILFPPKKSKIKGRKENQNFESFFFKNHKIMVGKNKKGNIFLLKHSKSNDIWMHLKDINSSHVIISTDKQNVSDDVLNFGAKLCVSFSKQFAGTYKVDYTKRKFVKVKNEANVIYTDFQTIYITTQ